MSRARPRMLRDARGIVMMEFLIALFPVMLAFLGTAQFAFATVAKLLVRHAAVVGARAAVVVIEESVDVEGTPEDLYGGLGAGEIEVEEEREDPAETNASGLQNASDNASEESDATGVMQSLMNTLDRGHSRIAQIRTAAYLPLLAASPNAIAEGLGFLVGAFGGEEQRDTLESAIGGAGVYRLIGAFLYNLGAVAVTFPKEPGSEEYRTEPYAHEDEVTVRVTYLFRCQVPLASLVFCDSGWALLSGIMLIDPGFHWEMRQLARRVPRDPTDFEGWQAEFDTAMSQVEKRQARLDAFDESSADLDQAESPMVQTLLLLQPGARYRVMRAEATLPVQSARYYPRSTDEDNGGGES